MERRQDVAKGICVLFAAVLLMGASQEQSDKPVAAIPPALQEKAKVTQGWEKQADTNKDGVVDGAEIKQWKNGPKVSRVSGAASSVTEESGVVAVVPSRSGQDAASQVNRPWEKAADKNKDGSVDKTEFNQWNQHGNNPPGKAGGPGRSGARSR